MSESDKFSSWCSCHKEQEPHTSIKVSLEIAQVVVQDSRKPVVAKDDHHPRPVDAANQVPTDLLHDAGEANGFSLI
jgi:hypothetical protein